MGKLNGLTIPCAVYSGRGVHSILMQVLPKRTIFRFVSATLIALKAISCHVVLMLHTPILSV